mgnify:CR=1 FL=1
MELRLIDPREHNLRSRVRDEIGAVHYEDLPGKRSESDEIADFIADVAQHIEMYGDPRRIVPWIEHEGDLYMALMVVEAMDEVADMHGLSLNEVISMY